MPFVVIGGYPRNFNELATLVKLPEAQRVRAITL
jgi:hypothetical protein